MKHFTNQDYVCIFVSAGQMTDLIHTEKELVQSLREYIKAEESKLTAVKRYFINPVTLSGHYF